LRSAGAAAERGAKLLTRVANMYHCDITQHIAL
jgi:hypothetical protein